MVGAGRGISLVICGLGFAVVFKDSGSFFSRVLLQRLLQERCRVFQNHYAAKQMDITSYLPRERPQID